MSIEGNGEKKGMDRRMWEGLEEEVVGVRGVAAVRGL